jgi:hypothetical protein
VGFIISLKGERMITTGQIDKLTDKFRLSPFQALLLQEHGERYNLEKLVKKGDVLYAPLVRSGSAVKRLFLGQSADLIGNNKILVRGRRGIKLHATGFYSFGGKYFDPTGQQIARNLFYKIV